MYCDVAILSQVFHGEFKNINILLCNVWGKNQRNESRHCCEEDYLHNHAKFSELEENGELEAAIEKQIKLGQHIKEKRR